MEACTAFQIRCTSIRKATVISLMIIAEHCSKYTVYISSKLSWTWTFPLALKYWSAKATKVPYKCMKCSGFFLWKESFHHCKAQILTCVSFAAGKDRWLFCADLQIEQIWYAILSCLSFPTQISHSCGWRLFEDKHVFKNSNFDRESQSSTFVFESHQYNKLNCAWINPPSG